MLCAVHNGRAQSENVIPDSIEFLVLKDLYDSLAGSSWTHRGNWPADGNWPSSATSAEMSTWEGVIVRHGDITRLSFYQFNMAGRLPSSLQQLSRLDSLEVRENQLVGPIPSWLGNLSQLRYLSLALNPWWGPIPASLKDLSELRHLVIALCGGVNGSIPQELGQLQKLEKLSLWGTGLSGEIPSSLGDLSALTELQLMNNQLTGALPGSIGNLTSLQALQINGNQLSGDLPSSLSNLSHLGNLGLFDNHFTGAVPSLSSLPSVWAFYVYNNSFSGTLPEFPSNHRVLHYDVSHNNISGVIPSSISNLANIQELRLHNNHFSGALPGGLKNLSGNYYTNLSNNDFSATDPDFFARVGVANITLLVNGNQLDFSQLKALTDSTASGTAVTLVPQNYIHDLDSIMIQRGDTLLIPSRPRNATTTITWHKKVGENWLDVTANSEDATAHTFLQVASDLSDEGRYYWSTTDTEFPGVVIQSDTIVVKMDVFDRVPDAVELQALKDFYDSLNGDAWVNRINWPLSGNWPSTATSAEFSTWFGLTVENGDVVGIGMNNNNLDGILPASFWQLSELKNFYVGGNQLKGGFPIVIFSLSELLNIDIGYNLFTGAIPTFDSATFNLSGLSMGANQFSGDFPDLSSQTNLDRLNLSYSNFTPGPLPGSLSSLVNLTQIYLTHTKRNGTIPDYLGNSLTHLGIINLDYNSFSGSIPSSLGNLAELVSLQLEYNQLEGAIPSSVGNLDRLDYLVLSNNKLTSMPSEIGDMQVLTQLVINDNELVGAIPVEIGNCPLLYNLFLGNNQLSVLPDLSGLNLNALDLTNNKLTGPIPSWLSSLDNLAHLGLGGNEFTGTLPAWFSSLTKLMVLNLRHTKLTGPMADMSQWSNLYSVDIAENQFDGDFPDVPPSLYILDATDNHFTSIPASVFDRLTGYYVLFNNNGARSIRNLDTYLSTADLQTQRGGFFQLTNSYLDFSSLVKMKQITANIVNFPQKAINDFDTILFAVGDTLLIPSRPRNVTTTTTWHKKVGASWIDISSDNEDATQGTFLKSAAPVSDEGLYYWSTTDTEFPGAVIQSDTIAVIIGESPALRIAALVRGVNEKEEGGSIQAAAQGGYSPYTYAWSSGETTSSIGNKGLGIYTITATDLLGKKTSHTYELGYKVGWSRTAGVSQSNGGLSKTVPAGWGNGGGYSSNVLLANDNGWLEFVLSEEQGDYVTGFDYPDGSYNYINLKHGFYVTLSGNIYFLDQENGAASVIDTGIKYHTGDVLRVERDNGEVKYYYNGQLLRTSPISSQEYVVKSSIYVGSSPAVVASFLSTHDAITRSLAAYDSLAHRIPTALKISRAGRKASETQERQHALSAVNEGFSEDVFLAPPCMEGSYYTGFQLYYDLGDEQTRKEWLVQMDISFLHGSDTLWTRPLQINLREQTFAATVFHDTVISCDGNYEYVISNKRNIGNAPEDNIHLKLLYHRMDIQPFSVSSPVTLNCDITAEKSLLSWNHSMEGTVAFDVEWVFIDSLENAAVYTNPGTTFTNPLDAFNFKEPVRVTLSGNELGSTLSNYLYFYPKGRVWHRVRAVGVNPAYPEHRINGLWNYGCSAKEVDNQQPDKNWARQTVFAEEGKYKEVVRYFDGTTRERQVQTNLSTEDVTLVGESLYDYEGRPSVQILPVPSEERSLKYKAGFNQFAPADPTIIANTSQSQLKFNYDNRRLENSVLSQGSGAARYYSASNNITTPITNKNYIPQANGHTYTQTEYTNDGTGRVSRQSGVGEVFRTDGNNTTRSFYGSATKTELVRLFGSNAGNATHYKKTMVLDANNQVSVTYLDQEGRTIATALAGDNPSNVDALESYTNLIPVPLTVDISDRNEKSNTALVLSHTLLNAVPNTPYTFKYDLAALASQVDTIGCEGCVFDLEMVLTDPDGAPVDLASVPGNEKADGLSYLRSGITAASCSDTLKVNDIEFTLLLNSVGDYTLTKTLTPRELSFERMRQLVDQTPAVLDQISQLTGLYSADSSECAICTESEDAIRDAIEEVATQDCESVLQQILSELQAPHENDDTPYEPTQAEIEGHALYCQYQLCTQDKAGDVFDRELSRYEGWTTAIAAGHTNLLEQDPFFNLDSLSGYNYKGSMQGKLNDVLVANVGYDNNGDGEQDGTTSYHGAIGAVTDPLNTAFYIDDNGNADVNGHHLLYAYAMSQRAELGETEYQKQLDAQHWSLYRNFYGEAKRRTKLEITEYKNCAGMKAQLGATDELPRTPDEVEAWAASQDATLVNEVSVPELNTALYNIKTKCDVQFSPADSTSISNHLQSYFNSNKNNFFRVLIKTDLAANAHLTAIQTILNNYSGCKLDSIAVDDPLTCLKTTSITIPAGLQSAVPKWILPANNIALMENKIALQKSETIKSEEPQEEISLEIKTNNKRFQMMNDSLMESFSKKMLSAIQKKKDSIQNDLLQKQIESQIQISLKSPKNTSRVALSNTATVNSIPLPSQAEYDALVDLYNRTNGANWTNTVADNKKWNPVPDTIQSIENWYGITVDLSGHVERIILNYNNLTDSIPASIGNFSHLDILILTSNHLVGKIPTQLQSLTQLKILNLYNNQLSGSIPSEIQYLSELEYLDLSANQLSGSIPPEIGQLTKLVSLFLYYNQLTGSIPAELQYLTDLNGLVLRSNYLSGSIPPELSHLTNLLDLDLNDNQLSGVIPSEFQYLTKLLTLQLRSNQLTGGIPTEFQYLTNLQFLDLGSNQITGSIPPEFQYLTNLTSLYLNDNQISGALPSGLGELTSLQELILMRNQFSGSIPEEWGKMNDLQVLNLSTNEISGSIPPELWNLSSLISLDLSINQLNGSISAEIGNLRNLIFLSFHGSGFNGNLPVEIGNLTQLYYLVLSYNNFTGNIPTNIKELTQLQYLVLNNNEFEGDIPVEIGNIAQLNTIAVEGNQFTFSNLLPLRQTISPPLFLYAPQDSVDVNKNVVGVDGNSITLTANIDRSVSSSYQWFKVINGVATALTQSVLNGYDYVIQNTTMLDAGEYYYQIRNSAAPDLVLASRPQTLTVIPKPPSKTYSICTYDETNPSLNRFTYTVDWNQQIVECMERQAKADSVLTEMAIEKLMDQRVSAYYNQYATQCLSKAKEKMTYTYLSKEYHYTLYYYDQGANLVQTVPPQGVHPLSIEQTNAFVKGTSADPAHTLVTRYKYNSLNQLQSQTTPDAGASHFLYNNKGQLRLSQNAQQQQGNVYSYTKYDEQGRILEVGETGILLPINDPILIDSIHTARFPNPNAYVLTDVTKTHYDFADAKEDSTFQQDYLRSRVAWVEVIDKEATDTVRTHYSYDLHGNVKSLRQSVPGLKPKRTDYVYDLVSGKVNYVMYQYGEQDQFIHQYDYDADNRIRMVHTSTDGYLWSKEADYDYYLHGPLSRTELGHYRVQGVDYHYTLQGWIKGVNMPYAGDPGADGLNGNKTGKDVFAYTLGYFSGDYLPINADWVQLPDNRDKPWNRAIENIQHTGLYNGNISWMETDLPTLGAKNNDRKKGVQAMLYRYDQLHRITHSRSLTSYQEGYGWQQRGEQEAYDEDYTYDANGNIMTLKRNDELATLKDDFVYDYYAGTNKLKNVKTTQTQNYTYDAIGNLISDAEEGVTISWTPYGKVRSVQKGDSVTTSYRYDASGNRVEMKTVKTDTTFITRYLRDASGNVMSIYKDTTTSETPIYGSARLGQYKGGVVEGHRTLGHRSYELSNHLGNVLAVISDNIHMQPTGTNADSTVWATVLNTSDYYPFGLEMKGRSMNVSTQQTTQGDCLECADLKTQLDNYVSTNGAAALSDRVTLTSYLNTQLNRNTTQAEYESSLKQCELVNTYASFTGGNYVDFGKQPQYELGTSDFTMEAWIRMPLNFSYDCLPIVTNQNNNNGYNGIHFTICSRRLGFSVSEGAPEADAVVFMNASFPDDGQWHHVVVERRGNRIADFRIYLDSVNVSSLDLQRDNLVTGNMNTGGLEALRIGTRKYLNSGEEYNIVGDIKQVRMYNRALSSTEVEQSYAQGLFGTTVNQNGLILWAPLDEGAGQQSKDESAYAEIGTHAGTGAAWKSELSTATCTTCPATVLCTTTSSSEASAYRYGFNGKEKDNFNATVYDYGFRIYNPEIAKFLSVDPLTKSYPWYTPYQFAGNSPIWAMDLDGLEPYRKTNEPTKSRPQLKIFGDTEKLIDYRKKIDEALKYTIEKKLDLPQEFIINQRNLVYKTVEDNTIIVPTKDVTYVLPKNEASLKFSQKIKNNISEITGDANTIMEGINAIKPNKLSSGLLKAATISNKASNPVEFLNIGMKSNIALIVLSPMPAGIGTTQTSEQEYRIKQAIAKMFDSLNPKNTFDPGPSATKSDATDIEKREGSTKKPVSGNQ